ncbi:MAG: pro-sigmaK processing inhibitor BofA family protein [Firmicutes bacterium]|nr:pro-sigmaK processing inhibitor BofA family protein [Bacillota bacterium]
MTTAIIAIAVVGILLLALLFKIIKTPIKWFFKLLIHVAIGFVALFVVNWLIGWLGAPASWELGLNWINALVAGVLGVPGVILLFLWQNVI